MVENVIEMRAISPYQNKTTYTSSKNKVMNSLKKSKRKSIIGGCKRTGKTQLKGG